MKNDKLYRWINTFKSDGFEGEMVDVIFNDECIQIPLQFIEAMNDRFDELYRAIKQLTVELETEDI